MVHCQIRQRMSYATTMFWDNSLFSYTFWLTKFVKHINIVCLYSISIHVTWFVLSGKLFDFRNHAIKYWEQKHIELQCNMSYIIPLGPSNSLSPRIRIQSITMMSTNIMFLAEQGARPIPPSKLFWLNISSIEIYILD